MAFYEHSWQACCSAKVKSANPASFSVYTIPFFPQQIQDEGIIQTKSFPGTTLYNQRRKNERVMLNDQDAHRNKNNNEAMGLLMNLAWNVR